MKLAGQNVCFCYEAFKIFIHFVAFKFNRSYRKNDFEILGLVALNQLIKAIQ